MQNRRIRKTRTTTQFFKAILWIAFGIAVIYYFIISDYGVITQIRLSRQEKETREKINSLKKEQSDLHKQISRLTQDTAYQEKIAREKYKLAKKGETIYLMVPKSKDSSRSKQRR